MKTRIESTTRPASGPPLKARRQRRSLSQLDLAPEFRQRAPDDQPLAAARRAIEAISKGHEPYSAFAFDRHWTLQLVTEEGTLFVIGPASVFPADQRTTARLHRLSGA